MLNITFTSDDGPASLVVDKDASAAITIGQEEGADHGDIILGSALNVTHNGSGLLTLGGRITGSNGITFDGDGTTRLGRDNTFTGTVNFNGGLVQFDANNRFGNAANALVFDGGGVQFTGDAANTLGAAANPRDLTINAGSATIDIATDRLLTLNNELTGSGDLTVTRSGDEGGRVLLANTDNLDSWTGNLIIKDGGQVDFRERNALGALNKTITLDDGTLRNINDEGQNQNLHANTTVSIGAGGGVLNASHHTGMLIVRGNITGTGLLTTAGNGVVNLAVSPNDWSGGLRVESGTTRIDAMGQVGSGDITLAGGTLEDSRADGVITGAARTVTIASNSTIRVTGTGDANHRINSLLAGSGDLTVAGGGTVTPSNTDNTFSGSWSVTEGSTVSVATAADGSNVRLGSGSNLDLDNGTLNFSGSAGGVENTHTRDTVLGAGGGTFELGNASGQNPTITWNGAISGEGALTVANKGGTTAANKLILGGANTFSGDTVIDSGSTLTLADTGSLTFTIGDDGENNQLAGEGTVNLNGTIVFDLTEADTTVGNTWTIVADTLTESYGGVFEVDGFVDEEDGTWTKEINAGTFFEFDQSTGVLEVKETVGPVVDPDIDSIGIVLDDGDVLVTVAFDASGNDAYTLQFTTNLVTGIWTDVATGSASPLSITNDTKQGFFRVKAE